MTYRPQRFSHVLSVGQPFMPGTPSYDEGTLFRFDGEKALFVLFMSRPDQGELISFQSARLELSLYVEPPAIVVSLRAVPFLQWSAAPFSWRLNPVSDLPLPELAPGQGYNLVTVYVDADTGIILQLRADSLPHDFSAAFHAAVAEQQGADFDERTYDAALGRIFNRFPENDTLAESGVMRCHAGS